MFQKGTSFSPLTNHTSSQLPSYKWLSKKLYHKKHHSKFHGCQISNLIKYMENMGVSENSGTPKSSIKNYTSVDPRQFTVSKFRLKPVILISEYFCSRCGHTNQHPPPPHEGREPETTGDKTTPHIKGDNRRQWETTGDKTTSEPKKPTTPTNTKAARSQVALRTPTVNCLGK